EGTVLQGPSFEPVNGVVYIENGKITDIEETPVESDDIILPAFVNGHTHIGDSIAKEAGRGLTLEELVAPPDGLKHQLLDEASRENIVSEMRKTLKLMIETGTASFIEFREGGVSGVSAIKEAAAGLDIEPFILGREEIDVLDVADGFGASGAEDADFTEARQKTREKNKFFAIHAGERTSADINPAIDLDPDLLVHMVQAEDIHLDRVEDNDIPIAVCPRSNLTTNAGLPPIEKLMERTTVALGTDNVMLNNPSMYREMEFVSKLYDISAPDILYMATRAGAKILDANYGIIDTGYDAKVQILDGGSNNLSSYTDPIRAVVRRATHSDVKEVHF
ncbi:MAG: amidohydrolase family protein, partial [Halobacteriaceae archaeon]